MTAVLRPVVIYVPGLLPKPQPELYRESLLQCLVAGIRRIDAPVADAMAAQPNNFDIIPWNYDFYGKHADFEVEEAAIAAVVERPQASRSDIAEASSWLRRLTRWVYTLGDLLPFLIPHFAPEKTEVHLRDLRRYERNDDGKADHTRDLLKGQLLAAMAAQRPVLLIAHSMGSIISYDSLWELSQEGDDAVAIDLFLTMGSPLGQRLIQKIIKGQGDDERSRYPGQIRRWKNLSAVGDLTAIDPCLANDFGGMVTLGLVDSIEDVEILSSYRLDGELGVHSEYGYLVNEKTASIVADWWREHDSLALP